jgi:hypothetical protein
MVRVEFLGRVLEEDRRHSDLRFLE